MKTLENNKMIAEFVGMQETSIGWYDFNEFLSLPNTQDNTFDSLEFDNDWNWLMPVVDKIMEYQNENEDSELALIVRDALCDVSIVGVYDAVIEFIEWYNE